MARVSFRKLRRRLFAMIAIISLVLCLATVGLWVRSYWRYDFVVRTLYQMNEYPDAFLEAEFAGDTFSMGANTLAVNRIYLDSVTGGIWLSYDNSDYRGPGADRSIWHRRAYVATPQQPHGEFHFAAYYTDYTDGTNRRADNSVIHRGEYHVAFPDWSLALLLAILPAWWLTPIVRTHRRARRGCCLNCGYDLRESPGRCPECGEPKSEGGRQKAKVQSGDS